ncbi:MAG: hypothetical protein ACT4QF_25285 [Sporichthyaceae bacterium]
MRWFGRRKQRPGTMRTAGSQDREHLQAWAAARTGVEAYLEPRTAVTEFTMMLIAADGEWTRRRVPSPEHARELCKKLKIPVYDAALVGYPDRKRAYDRRRANEGR